MNKTPHSVPRMRTPSDALSETDLAQFDARAHEDFETLFGDRQFDPQAVHASLLSAMKFKEHQLLHKTYAFTLEWDDPYPQVTHSELVESLAKDYRAFGLTVGKHHSDELVRDFERTVRRAALATLGPTY